MKSDIFQILFVCTGNSCRSPMAEGLMKQKIPSELRDKVKVQSAGTLGLVGNPATEYAIEAAREKGADLSDHKSQGVTETLLKDSDLIFVMSSEHKIFLENRFPDVRENIFLLKKFGREPGEKIRPNIEDPIGESYRVYQKCCKTIETELERIWPTVESLIEAKLK